MTRDEILAQVKELRFSSRACFFDILDQLSWKLSASGKVVKIRWPEALGVLTIEDWNRAWAASMEMAQEHRGRAAQ